MAALAGNFLPIPSSYGPLLLRQHSHDIPLIRTVSACRNQSAIKSQPVLKSRCGARRRVMYEQEDYEHNPDIAMLESYTQAVKDEVLLVKAGVDDIQLELDLVIFKGFSSCLNSKTSSDPSKSVVPANAVIKSIDRIRGPFDPDDINYIEKGLSFDEFKSLWNEKL